MNISYNTYHIFEKRNRYYMFDNQSLLSCKIDKHIFEALAHNNSSLLSEGELHLFRKFKELGVFFVDTPCNEYSSPQYDIAIISMAIFHACNLHCKYCFADAGANFIGEQKAFTTESISAAIDFLLKDPYFSKINYYRINLVSGGEPLLNKPLFRLFIKMVFSRFQKAGKQLYVWFSTNGTLLAPDDLKFISQYNVGYGISIDGTQEEHDSLRVYKNSAGTYTDIVENINKVKSSPDIPNRLKEFWGLMVYTKLNKNLYQSLLHLRDIGFSTVQMRFVRTTDATMIPDTNSSIDELTSFIKKIFESAILGDLSVLTLITNDNDYIGKIIKRIVLQRPCEVRCLAGTHMFSFAADGKIYPCDCFVGNPNFVIGNYYTGFHKEQLSKYQDLSVHVREKCSKCWAKYVCGGDCYHNSFIKNGSVLSPDDSYCKVIIEIVEEIIVSINQFESENKTAYDSFRDFLRIRDKMSRK